MKTLASLILTVTALVSAVYGAVDSDRITSLPGWNGALPTAQYSGYFSISGGKHMHYWFVESENDPSKDPVIAWYNGGPGCSSLGGFFQESGPFTVNVTENGPILVERATRWNKFANMLYVDSPAGVGFSYTDSSAGLYTNDSVTAKNNYETLQAFFAAYSEYRNNDFYLAGESYAGVYVPTLAMQIYEYAGHYDPPINLKGLMVGNGCTGTEVGTCGNSGSSYTADFLYRKGLYSDELYNKIDQACFGKWNHPPAECTEALAQMAMEVGPVNVYDIYAPCINSGESSVNYGRPLSKLEREYLQLAQEKIFARQRNGEYGVPPGPGPVGCINGGGDETYLNQESVKQAIHISPQAFPFAICSSNVHYTPTEKDEPSSIYPTLIKNYRVLIYNGDVDSCVPFVDNEMWTRGMFLDVKSSWRPWYVNDQVAGYITQYVDDFTFMTVKGAGHMVPQFKPEQAYAMMYRFVHNLPLTE